MPYEELLGWAFHLLLQLHSSGAQLSEWLVAVADKSWMDGRNREFHATAMGKRQAPHDDPCVHWPPVLDYVVFTIGMPLLGDLKAGL